MRHSKKINERVKPSTGGKEVFFHCSEILGGSEFKALRMEQAVEYDQVDNDKGPSAINIMLGEQREDIEANTIRYPPQI